MTNAELEQLLRKAPVPERPPEYWEQFPERVAAKAVWRKPAAEPLRHAAGFHQAKPALWLWLAGVASACLLLGFAIGFWRGRGYDDLSNPVALARKYYQEIEPMFPHQVQAIVFDQKGARLVLAEAPTVPDSPPVFVRISGPGGSQNFVTFSGQQIRVNGDVFEVLVDRRGEVLLVGQQWVWSSVTGSSSVNAYQISAQPLGRAS